MYFSSSQLITYDLAVAHARVHRLRARTHEVRALHAENEAYPARNRLAVNALLLYDYHYRRGDDGSREQQHHNVVEEH